MNDCTTFIQCVRVLTAENQIIQNIQLLLLGAIGVMLARSILTSTGASRTLAVGLGAGALLAFFRELDIRHLDVPQWSIDLTSGPIRDTWFAGVIVLTLGYAVYRRADTGVILLALGRKRFRPLLIGMGFLAFGQCFELVFIFFDNADFHLYHYLRLGEELAELIGYAVLCVAAFRLMTAPAMDG